MKIELAKNNAEEIITFFDKYLTIDNKGITSLEFFCPWGVRAAIKRKQMMVCLVDNKVVAAVRFYPRKREVDVASVYQFAIDAKYRGNKLLRQLLFVTGYKEFKVICPLEVEFNDYYRKTGWFINKQDEQYNYWSLVL